MNNLSENIKNLKFMKKAEENPKPIQQNQQQWSINFQIPQTAYSQIMQNRTQSTKELTGNNQNTDITRCQYLQE